MLCPAVSCCGVLSQLNAAATEVTRLHGLSVIDLGGMVFGLEPKQYLDDQHHPNKVRAYVYVLWVLVPRAGLPRKPRSSLAVWLHLHSCCCGTWGLLRNHVNHTRRLLLIRACK
jgi:hypothetical protein